MARCFDVTVVLLVFGCFFLFLFFWFVFLVYLPVEPVQTKKKFDSVLFLFFQIFGYFCVKTKATILSPNTNCKKMDSFLFSLFFG